MTFGQCPRRYYLEQYIGWKERKRTAPLLMDDDDAEEPEFDEPAGAEFGLEVHSLLAGASMEGASPAAAQARRRGMTHSARRPGSIRAPSIFGTGRPGAVSLTTRCRRMTSNAPGPTTTSNQ